MKTYIGQIRLAIPADVPEADRDGITTIIDRANAGLRRRDCQCCNLVSDPFACRAALAMAAAELKSSGCGACGIPTAIVL